MFGKKPYDLPFWQEEDNFYIALKNQVDKHDLPFILNRVLLEAVYDTAWTPSVDFDGCTLIEDMYHPCLWCFIHDWMWKTGMGGSTSDRIMFKLAYRMQKKKITRANSFLLKIVYGLYNIMIGIKILFFYIFVRVAWLLFFKWKNYFYKNKKPLPKILYNLDKDL